MVSTFLTPMTATCWQPRSRGSAEVIVTMNLRDFPPARLAPHQVKAQHPDDFVLGLITVACTHFDLTQRVKRNSVLFSST